jgi:uncharacterized protein YjbJ (UPF0337 family)
MNQDILEGKWRQLSGDIKRRWGKLTDDDVDIAKGDLDVLAGRLQERYGYARDRARREIDDFLAMEDDE